MKEQFLLAALHESSHLICAYRAGCKLTSICIGDDGTGLTVVVHPIFKHLADIKNEGHPILKSFVDFNLSGIAAERYHTGCLSKPLTDRLHDEDIFAAMSFMENRGWQPPKSNFSCSDFFNLYSGRAKFMVIANWREISELAAVLMEKRFLSGFECAKFLEGIWQGPLPSKALPYTEHKK